MKTYWKILLTVLPLVLFFLLLSVGTTYYFSRKALISLAETWLETRLTEALNIAEEQMAFLQRYGLESVPASIEKAKMDAGAAMAGIEVGELGFVFVVSAQGIVSRHPDEDMVGRDVSGEAWFAEIQKGEQRPVFWGEDNANMARVAYFEPWEWFILATSPEKEIYGVANEMKPYILYLAVMASIAMSLVLMIMTRRRDADGDTEILGAVAWDCPEATEPDDVSIFECNRVCAIRKYDDNPDLLNVNGKWGLWTHHVNYRVDLFRAGEASD